MNKSEIISKILHNQSLLREKLFATNFPEAYAEICNWIFPNNFVFKQKAYHYLHNDSELKLGVCPMCGKRCCFLSFGIGYRTYCSRKCLNASPDTVKHRQETCAKKYGNPAFNNSKKIQATNIKKYGVANVFQLQETKEKSRKTCLEKYGTEYPSQSETFKENVRKTCLEKYGVEHPSQTPAVKEQVRKTCLEKYGVDTNLKDEKTKNKIRETNIAKYGNPCSLHGKSIEEKTVATWLKKYGVAHPLKSSATKEKSRKTCLEKYGTEYPSQSETFKENVRKTCLEKYGVEWFCMTDKARCHSNNSKINLAFAELLSINNIHATREQPLCSYSYDFKVNDTLIEINPTITHNSFLNIFGGEPKKPDYHLLKTNCASDNNYRCIHIWDWDNVNKIISMLKPKQTLYARKLELKEVNADECNAFLNAYHLQNTCKGQNIRLGLYNNDMLVELMTFGKPRYNKNYEYELLRLCSHSDYIVVGGAERLFKYFVEKHKPTSVISYCDASKFSGEIYNKLGFELKSISTPTKHWYNPKTQQHITDNLLRQRGFDQLFNADYGKGTDNEELMLEHGFLPVYDCGQMRFEWKTNV